MGGAIAIQSLEYDERINFGVVESTFTELDQIVYDYQKRFSLGIGLRFATNYSLKEAGNIASFNPDDVKPINSVRNIEQPMFISHGDSDERITHHYGQQLFENLKSTDKTFELVKGAGHLNMFQVGGEAYKSKIFNFIDKQL
jgi:pimeloyl-ACP methyl ester carboxylesterase